MLRVNKFAVKKKNPLNKFLKDINTDDSYSVSEKIDSIKFYIHYFDLYFKEYLQFEIIKEYKKSNQNNKSIPYTIIKESCTETWFLVCEQLVMFYINENDIEEFYLSFLFNKMYKFIIYYDNNQKCYIAFCVSHTRDDICTPLAFFVGNNYYSKYFVLSHFLQTKSKFDNENCDESNNESGNQSYELKSIPPCVGFVILNRNMCTWFNDKSECKVDFYKDIGYGKQKHDLNCLVKTILFQINNSKRLPVNYLNF
jgi:hypothetical protein